MLGHFLQSEVSFGPKYNGKSLKTFEFELSSMRRVDHYKSVWGTGKCLYDVMNSSSWFMKFQLIGMIHN